MELLQEVIIGDFGEINMKVCFFSPTAYSYFDPAGKAWAGGAEIQQVLVARHMLKRGIDVSFIVGDFGQPDAEIIDGITLIKSFEPGKGNRKLRFIPDMVKIRRAMQIADADVYNQRSTSFFTGQLAHFASRLGKAFTFSIGSIYNCYPDGDGYLSMPVSLLYRYGIRKCSAVIAQTDEQRHLFKTNFGREAVVIRSGIPIPDIERLEPKPGADISPGAEGFEFLWVGSMRRLKRPELYLELARRVPGARFTIIGGELDDKIFYKQIIEEMKAIKNIFYLGFVPPTEIDRYYRRAYALINTSSIEGFPNTYLHAWVHGIPTLTIEIDPDGVIAEYGCGEVAGDLNGLVDTVKRLSRDSSLRASMSVKARNYVEENHDIEKRGDDYIRLFEKLVESSRRSVSSRSG